MIHLPVSGVTVLLRLPDGADEVALVEGESQPIAAALRLLDRIATPQRSGSEDWSRLPVTDFEVLLLHLRQQTIGETVASDVGCPHCRERVEISFDISQYLAAIQPKIPHGVTPGASLGRFAWRDQEFRLPLLADLLAVRNTAKPGAALRVLCLAPETPARLRPSIEGFIARLAPEVSGPVGGHCPACATVIEAQFDVPSFVVAELRRRAAEVYAEVHLIAAAYGWAEAAILALPGARRRHYAEMLRDVAESSLAHGSRYLAVA
jgi:hypothetical protein